MNKVVEFLNTNPVQYLATVGRDGKAKCRPFMFAGELDGKLWFCTNNQKDVYKDLQHRLLKAVFIQFSKIYAFIPCFFPTKMKWVLFLRMVSPNCRRASISL